MSDEGYTLAEMLAALTILGLALGGLGLVASLIARQQLTANRIQMRLVDDRAADVALAQWLAEGDAQTIHGNGVDLSLACGEATCSARLHADDRRTVLVLQGRSGQTRRLRLRQQDVRFGYVDGRGLVATWPRSDPSTTSKSPGYAERNVLGAVVLSERGVATPLAVARAWTREPRDCQFDAIIGACRAKTP